MQDFYYAKKEGSRDYEASFMEENWLPWTSELSPSVQFLPLSKEANLPSSTVLVGSRSVSANSHFSLQTGAKVQHS